MPGFQQLPSGSMPRIRNALGTEVTRLQTNGAMLTVVTGKAGDLVPPHGYSHGSVTYVVSGRLSIDGQVLAPGDAGMYEAGAGYFAVRFLEDSVYVVARATNDELTLPDIGEESVAHPDA